MGRVLVQQPGTNTAKALTETLPKNVIIVDEDLKELRLHDGVTPGGKLIGQSAGSGVPIGTIIPFAGNSVPQGYLLCDGSAISRTDYASLFAVIGTIYGAGDGNSTFNLPNRKPERVCVMSAGPNSNDPYKQWHRVYSDGWVEEGGYIKAQQVNRSTTTNLGEPQFIWPRVNKEYDLQFTFSRTGTYWSWVECCGYKLTNGLGLHFELYNNSNVGNWIPPNDANGVYWKVAGYTSSTVIQKSQYVIKYI